MFIIIILTSYSPWCLFHLSRVSRRQKEIDFLCHKLQRTSNRRGISILRGDHSLCPSLSPRGWRQKTYGLSGPLVGEDPWEPRRVLLLTGHHCGTPGSLRVWEQDLYGRAEQVSHLCHSWTDFGVRSEDFQGE